MKYFVKNFFFGLYLCALVILGVLLFLLIASFCTLGLVEAWVFLLGKALPLSNLELKDYVFSIQGFYTFPLLLVVFLSSFVNLKTEKISYSENYLKCFKKPEMGVQLWLNFNFYFGALSGALLTFYSIYSLLNLCLADISLMGVGAAEIDPDIFVGYYIKAAKHDLAVRVGSALVLIFLSTLSIWFLGKFRGFVFLQALFLVGVSGVLLLGNFLNLWQLAMLELINSLLLASILASIVCAINHFLKLATSSQAVKRFFLRILKKRLAKYLLQILGGIPNSGLIADSDKVSRVTKKQYLLSSASLLSCTYFINWFLLFASRVEHSHSTIDRTEQLNLSNWMAIGLSFLWVYMAWRYLRFSANFSRSQTSFHTCIPLPPVILGLVYLGPFFEIFYSTWLGQMNTHSQTGAKGKIGTRLSLFTFGFSTVVYWLWKLFYSFLLALLDPTRALTQNISYYPPAVLGASYLIASPAEGGIGFLEKYGSLFIGLLIFSKPIVENSLQKKAEELQRKGNELAKTKIEGLVKDMRSLEEKTVNPGLKADLKKVLENTYRLQDPQLSLEEQTKILKDTKRILNITINKLPDCVDQLGSPRSSIVRPEHTGDCLSLQLKLSECLTETVNADVDRLLKNASTAAERVAASIADQV
jgi:hypothetical protein